MSIKYAVIGKSLSMFFLQCHPADMTTPVVELLRWLVQLVPQSSLNRTNQKKGNNRQVRVDNLLMSKMCYSCRLESLYLLSNMMWKGYGC